MQNSFWVHFTLFGGNLNLIFIFFSLLIFFQEKKMSFRIFFYVVVAGFFADIFLNVFLGASICAFLVIAFLSKQAQHFLVFVRDKYPIIYFMPLFLAGLLVYKILIWLTGFVPHFYNFSFSISWKILWELVYNGAVAALVFWIYKKFLGAVVSGRQLSLFQ